MVVLPPFSFFLKEKAELLRGSSASMFWGIQKRTIGGREVEWPS